jgi:hypothetical protein
MPERSEDAESAPPTPLEDYRFDLDGFLVLRGAASCAQVAAANAEIDLWRASGAEWIGNVHALPPTGALAEYRSSPGSRHVQTYHNVVEAGGVFEEFVDHPGWIRHVRRYTDDDGLHLWMNFVTATSASGGTSLHSGGHGRHFRSSFHYHDGAFHCGNVVVIVALTDIGPGDGPTVVIPGSHKSNRANPVVEAVRDLEACLGQLGGMVRDVHLGAGDALVFTDAVLHGGRPRENPGERRILVYRYAPFWTKNRMGYEPSEELVARLSPARRAIVRPIAPVRPPVAALS